MSGKTGMVDINQNHDASQHEAWYVTLRDPHNSRTDWIKAKSVASLIANKNEIEKMAGRLLRYMWPPLMLQLCARDGPTRKS